MSENQSLKATVRQRSGTGALKAMRREGFVPAVLYGAKQESMNIKVDAKGFTELLKGSVSERILVDLEIEGESGGAKLALIQDVQHHAVSRQILHADFHAVSKTDTLHTTVPLHLTGTAKGVKSGGVLEHQIHEISVRCLPADLPEVIEVDVSELKMGDALHVKDVVPPKGVEIDLDGEVVVALITEPRVGGESPADLDAAADELAEESATVAPTDLDAASGEGTGADEGSGSEKPA
ncbi:50S ribosomal protein L25/general stress protein Ctc [soil metagenome]